MALMFNKHNANYGKHKKAYNSLKIKCKRNVIKALMHRIISFNNLK
uniref:Uncharacterized protein MANES_14G080800 n=1 Tax=Rhizophora mucronata TaxID=61149 RepID=A0A2P2JJR8_RHIMU